MIKKQNKHIFLSVITNHMFVTVLFSLPWNSSHYKDLIFRDTEFSDTKDFKIMSLFKLFAYNVFY